MEGIHLKKIENQEQAEQIRRILNRFKDYDFHGACAEQYHDDGEGEDHAYHVYRIEKSGSFCVLKKSDKTEVQIYTNFLEGHGFSVPKYLGNAEWNNTVWLLTEYIPGTDLREFTGEMAKSCAESLSKIFNCYWQNGNFEEHRLDHRFEKYWKRIQRRHQSLKSEPRLESAYRIFLDRQLTAPRTLCNGDFLQYNAIFHGGRVTIIDWAFGGIMPYSLDIARLITHGNENRFPFPYYMNDDYRNAFVRELYQRLEHKPNYKQYIRDITLSALNECIEFIEDELNDASRKRDRTFDFYYGLADKISDSILTNTDSL